MRFSTALTLLAAFSAAACAKSSPSSPTTNSNNTGNNTPAPVDLNTRINELLAEINSRSNAIGQGAGGGGAADLIPSGGGRLSATISAPTGGPSFDTTPADNAAVCTLDSLAAMWSCPTQTLPSGLTSKVSFQFLSATNTPQLHFDTVATAAIRRIADLTGTISQPLQTDSGPVPAVQTTNNHEDIILSAISTSSHLQNGTGTLGQTIAAQGRDTAFITAPDTTKNIVTGPGKPYPLGGSFTAVVHTVQGATSSTTTQVTSFNGTTTATLVITFAGGAKRTCTYDMTSTAAPTCTGP